MPFNAFDSRRAVCEDRTPRWDLGVRQMIDSSGTIISLEENVNDFERQSLLVKNTSNCFGAARNKPPCEASQRYCDRTSSQILAPRMSTFSIEGGVARSSGALAISAFAIGPLRCVCRPVSS